ncbi:MAG: hypothetical protein ACO1O6_11975 [Bacteroidota bacterium]
MKKIVFYIILVLGIHVKALSQQCTPDWTYGTSYEIETGYDGDWTQLDELDDDIRWERYFGNTQYGPSYLEEFPGLSDKLGVLVPRETRYDEEPYYKGIVTRFYISPCATLFDLDLRFRFRDFSDAYIYVNGEEVYKNLDDHQTMLSTVELDDLGAHLHPGPNYIHIRTTDFHYEGDDNTLLFMNANVVADGPIFCYYDTDYKANMDSDEDGVKDVDEPSYLACNPGESSDCDADGVGDIEDLHDDSDGIPDETDAFPCDPNEWADSDEDGIGDNADPVSGECCKTFQPQPGERYWLSAWVKEDLSSRVKVKSYWRPVIEVEFLDEEASIGVVSFYPSGEIIDGWQRIVGELPVPSAADKLDINLINRSQNTPDGYADVFFDDIRIHPFNGSMKSFVYDPETLWLTAELDDNNYATFYEYDNEGQLIRIKKETARGIMTIQESRMKMTNSNNNQVLEPELESE